jgi:hypothetical protein
MPVELQRVKQVFLAAVEKSDRAARNVYLDDACAGDDELRRQVEALLAQHEQASGHLEAPPASFLEKTGPFAVTACETASPEAAGNRIGPYKLLQQLGEGGMGTVYLAEQEEPVKRRVALKIIKAGMDSARIIARFEAGPGDDGPSAYRPGPGRRIHAQWPTFLCDGSRQRHPHHQVLRPGAPDPA